MKRITRIRTSLAIACTMGVAMTATMLTAASGPKFFNDDPVQVERDTQDASKITPVELNLVSDLGYNIIKGNSNPADVRAQNLNTVDEVPDSSWFTNRAGSRPLTAADVAIGPNTSNGPSAGPWTVIKSKSDGVTPGFTIRDAKGDVWFLKFDPRGYRGMTTGTEVAVTKLVWALGYHVPENHIAYFRPAQLVIDSNAKYAPSGGTARTMRMADVAALLRQVDREADGSYRVVASKALPGKPVGRLRFFGTRPDDPNDLVPHEHRRELRGLRVFAAWLNHADTKAINSLDTLITEGSRSFVRHHLIDFGSALGSGGFEPAEYWRGGEYLVAPRQAGKRMIGFGLNYRRWHTADFFESPALGRLPAHNDDFDPDAWKPRVPNRAFLHARADDKFWAARKLAAITPEMIAAAVGTGEFGDPRSEAFLVQALIERRAAILRAYLTTVNPISDPALDAAGTLTFTNAAVAANVASAPAGYRAVWSRFDNATSTSERIGETSTRTTTVGAPATLPNAEGAYVRVAVTAVGGSDETWEAPVEAYFRLRDGQWRLVGFERLAH